MQKTLSATWIIDACRIAKTGFEPPWETSLPKGVLEPTRGMVNMKAEEAVVRATEAAAPHVVGAPHHVEITALAAEAAHRHGAHQDAARAAVEVEEAEVTEKRS